MQAPRSLWDPTFQEDSWIANDVLQGPVRLIPWLKERIDANYPGTGFVLHPHDWEDIELQKANGDGQYMLVTNIAIGAQTQVWRQPVVETVAIAEKTFLTGAFGLGAQLYDREQANVRVAEQHADFFVRNAVVVLVEERIALAVKRPEAFVKGTFFTPA